MIARHKVFVSFHHGVEYDPKSGVNYKNKFVRLFQDHSEAIISKAVQEGDIDPYSKTETIRQKIRDNYLRDSTVTVVLIGPETWKRKHVDWEISSSIRDTPSNPRSGLLGLFLPTHPDHNRERFDLYHGRKKYNSYTIPPRLYKNVECGFAKLYDWTEEPSKIMKWIHEAFERRKDILPDNSFSMFKNNRSGERWQY